MTTPYNGYQTVQQLCATEGAATDESINSALKDLHTALPGIVEAFDAGTQSARVVPAIQRIFTERGALTLPVCLDVPVMFPQCGDFAITYPLLPGDEVILGFFERCIDRWYDAGGFQEPATYRMHDLSDGFAIPGISNRGRAIPAFRTDALVVRTRAGNAYIALDAGGHITMDGVDMTVLCPSFFQKPVTFSAGMTGSTSEGGAAFTISGAVQLLGSFTVNGKNVSDTHTHGGIQPGSGTSGVVS